MYGVKSKVLWLLCNSVQQLYSILKETYIFYLSNTLHFQVQFINTSSVCPKIFRTPCVAFTNHHSSSVIEFFIKTHFIEFISKQEKEEEV